MHLAQLSSENSGPFLIVVVGGSAALFLINQALTFWKDHMRERPTPSDTYATKAEHCELKGRVRGVEEKLESNFRALDQKRSVSIAGLHDDLRNKTDSIRSEMKEDNLRVHDRITEVLGKVSELKGWVQK
jgi:hypothetical protein